jgi:hypothetical protein
MTDLRALAIRAIESEAATYPCPDEDYDRACAAAFDARETFLASLREATGIEPELFDRLKREGLL